MTTPITNTISRLRNPAGWWEGDANASKVLDALIEGYVARITTLEADLTDLRQRYQDRGEDVLRLQGELADMRAARDDAVIAAHLIHQQPTTPPENKL